jgi:hypothetical protein
MSANVLLLDRRFRQTLVFAVSAYVGIVVLAFPGHYTPDSSLMLQQAFGLMPSDNWHSPYLVQFFGVLGFLNLPILPWLVQIALYVFSMSLLWFYSRRRVSKVVIIVGVFSPIGLAISGVLWKDSWIACAFLGLLAACALARRAKGWTVVLVSFLGLVILISRPTAFPLVFPVAVWIWRSTEVTVFIKRFRWSPSLRARLSLMVSFMAILVVASGLLSLGGSRLTDRVLAPESATFVWDIVAISSLTGRNLVPADVQTTRECSVSDLREQYSTVLVDPALFTDDACVYVLLPESFGSQLSFVASSATTVRGPSVSDWFSVVASHPSAYLFHRLGVATQLLGLRSDYSPLDFGSTVDVGNQAMVGASIARVGLPSTTSKLHGGYHFLVSQLSLEPLKDFLRPVFVLLIALCVSFYLYRFHRFSAFVVISGLAVLFFILITIFTAPGAVVRYFFPVYIWSGVLIVCWLETGPGCLSRRLLNGRKSSVGSERPGSAQD